MILKTKSDLQYMHGAGMKLARFEQVKELICFRFHSNAMPAKTHSTFSKVLAISKYMYCY